MDDKIPSTANTSAVAAEQTPVPVRFLDTTALSIISSFALLALVVVIMMSSNYQLNRSSMLSDKYYYDKEYDKAIPYLKVIVETYPDAYFRVKMLADSYMLKDQPDPRQAQAYYKKMQESTAYQQAFAQADPVTKATLDLNEELGICASLLGEEKKAQEYFSKVLAQQPDSSAANYFQGVQYFKAGNYRQAARCFQNAATGDQPGFAVVGGGEDSPEAPKPSKWGDTWSKKAAPYREKIARAILANPLTPPPAEQAKSAGKG